MIITGLLLTNKIRICGLHEKLQFNTGNKNYFFILNDFKIDKYLIVKFEII